MCALAGGQPGQLEENRKGSVAPVPLTLMRGMLAMAEGDHAEAERCLRQAALLEQKKRLAAIFGSARLLLAHFYLERNRPQDALAELEPVLAECEQQDTPGLILQQGAAAVPVLRLAVGRSVHADPSLRSRASFAAHLLDLLGAPVGTTLAVAPVRVPETGETLTAREVEVLRLIAAGASNRAIAQQLVITEGTVKGHVHRIFRKLDVTSRTQAAARARELRLV